MRVLVPSDKSHRWGYGGKLSVSIPYMKVRNPKSYHNDEQAGEEYWDISRTTQLPQAMDFSSISGRTKAPDLSCRRGRIWFIQTSTDELRAGNCLFSMEPEVGIGRPSCPNRAVHTWRFRPVWPAPSWSICP